jgi:hypothetical protein
MSTVDLRYAAAAPLPGSGSRRLYGLVTFVNTVGVGMVTPALVLYCTQVVHLSPVQVGLGFTFSGLAALLANGAAARLAGRFGPRGLVRATMLLQGLASGSYLFIQGFTAFLVVAVTEMLVTTVNMAALEALFLRVGAEDPVAFQSTVGTLSGLGVALGALCAAVAIHVNTADAYRVMLIVNGLTFLFGCALLRRLPRYRPPAAPRYAGYPGIRPDRQLVAYTVLAAAMSIQDFVVELPLPLWTVGHTRAPRWSVALFLLLNIALVGLLQPRVGRNVRTLRQAGTALLTAGAILLVSCTAIGLASALPGWAALVLLLGAVALHVYGGLWFSRGCLVFCLGLASRGTAAAGRYPDVAAIGPCAGSVAAPVVLVGLVLGSGPMGWVGLGGGLFLLGVAAPGLARWAQRCRPVETATREMARPPLNRHP